MVFGGVLASLQPLGEAWNKRSTLVWRLKRDAVAYNVIGDGTMEKWY